jgi:hypothetical protein
MIFTQLLKSFVCLFLASFAYSQELETSTCNNYNNNCQSCVQYAREDGVPVHTCSFCFVDGICHTVGSLFNKCNPDQCVSLSSASSCTMKTIDSCNAFVYGKKYLR